MTADDRGLEIECAAADTDPATLLRALVQAGVAVAAFTPIEADLEDTFLRVTQDGEPA